MSPSHLHMPHRGPVTMEQARHRVHGSGAFGKLNRKVALLITAGVGSMIAAYLFAFIALISLPSTLASGQIIILVAWVAQTFLQLVLLPIIIVGQNVQAEHSDMRAQQDFDTNVKAEAEIENLLTKIDENTEITRGILEHLRAGRITTAPEMPPAAPKRARKA